jgi:hypothetical protein
VRTSTGQLWWTLRGRATVREKEAGPQENERALLISERDWQLLSDIHYVTKIFSYTIRCES